MVWNTASSIINIFNKTINVIILLYYNMVNYLRFNCLTLII